MRSIRKVRRGKERDERPKLYLPGAITTDNPSKLALMGPGLHLGGRPVAL